jgi:hypothetical protein
MRRLLCALLVVAGCEKAKHVDSTKQADALWALAPANMQIGIVVTPRGVGMLDHAWQDIRTFMRTAPELAPAATKLDAALQLKTGSSELSLAGAGLTADKGAAVFVIDEHHTIVIFPLADRDTFLARVHVQRGSGAVDRLADDFVCKRIKGVYACGDTEQVIDAIGTLKSPPHLDARGDIEVVVEKGPMSGPFGTATGALQLERGGFIVRGTMHDVPGPLATMLGQPVQARVDADHTAGFIALSLAGVKNLAPPVPIGAGVTLASLAQSLAGPTTITFAPGAMAFDARMPLVDPAPAQTLIDHCTEFLPPLAGATVKDGRCSIRLWPLPETLTAWIEKSTLHVAVTDAPKSGSVALTAIATELAHGTWNAAVWGRGTLVAAPFSSLPPMTFKQPEVRMGLRAATMFSETGIGVRVDGNDLHVVGVVRTAFANPDDVVAKLATIPMDDIFAGHGAERAKAFAGTATPLAADLKAGSVGMLAPLGLVSAITVPMMLDGRKRVKRTEAQISFEQLGGALTRTYVQTGAFPIGKVGPTPAASCCDGPNHYCLAEPEEWATGPWHALGFHPSEPKLFQYSYQSDGKTAEIDAIGDLDCDGIAITYRLKASGDHGMPHIAIEEPPPNTD